MTRHDIATAFGRLRARRGYTLLAASMLTVAIASNVAVFTVLSRTLLRAFPFDADRLALVYNTHLDASGERRELPTGPVEFVHWQKQASTLEGLEVARVFAGAISDRGETESIKVCSVSGGIFRLLHVRPAIGSDFTAADDRPEAATAILSDGLWRRRFGADRSIIGRSIVIDGAPKRIIGVMPARFEIPNNRADAYVPAGFSLANMPNPGSRSYSAFARMKPGVTSATATADLQRISRELEVKFAVSHKDFGALVKPLREALFGERRAALLTLFIAVLLVHVLACVNVANLMLAQISDQQSVTAVRLAIGARPSNIIRYRIIEGLLLSAAAAIAGIILGHFAVGVILRHYADPELLLATPRSAGLITAFIVALTALTAAAVSLLPAWRESRVSISSLINEGSQRTSSSVERRRARELFIVAEIALAIPLLIGAAVAVKRLRDLQTFDIGFKPDGLVTAQLIMPSRYDKTARTRFAAELIRRMETTPGIVSAAITTCTFRVNGGASTILRSETMADFASVNFRRITPDFFNTMQSPLIAGRAFNAGDLPETVPVAIVSESLARRFWPGENPIGKKLVRKSQGAAWMTVVGVAREIRDAGVAEDLGPTVYTPFLQNNHIYVSLVARTNGRPAALAGALEKAVQSIDHNLAPDEIVPFRQLVDETLGSYKLQVALLGGFALIALALAATGIFAVTAYGVSRRMPEIGVRMAFGASPRAVVSELVRAAGKSVAAGVLIGVAITVAVVRGAPLVSSIRAEVDLRYAATVVAILIASAMLASLLPALRARTARPAELLRRG